MRAAPAVQFDVETGVLWRVGLWFVSAVAVAGVLAWAVLVNTPAAWVVVALAAVYAAVLAWTTRRPRRARLAWDGAGWSWSGAQPGAACRGEIAVALDLGGALLLRFVPAGRAPVRWVALQRTPSLPWHALRCALYSPRPAPAGAAG